MKKHGDRLIREGCPNPNHHDILMAEQFASAAMPASASAIISLAGPGMLNRSSGDALKSTRCVFFE